MDLHLSGTVGDRFAVWRLTGPLQRVGRSSRNEIAIADPTVSKDHAEITNRDGRLYVRDLNSRNGTRVNGVEALEPLAITPGDRVEIGHVLLAVTREEPSRPVKFSDATVLGSSMRIRADRLLDRRDTEGFGSPALMQLLAQAGQLLVLPRPLRETCDQILELAERAVPASRYVLLLRREGGGDPVQMAGRVKKGGADRPLALSRSIVQKVFDECTSVLTADAALDPRFQGQQSIVLQAVHSAMAVPLFDNTSVLGLIYVDSQDPTIAFREDQLEILTLLANMAAVKITNAHLLEAEQVRARMAHDLATAAGIQRALLQTRFPELPGYTLDAHLETCFEVGGDLYDYRVRPDGSLIFVLADVSGKGMGAALVMSSFLASARVLYDACEDPGVFATRMGAIIYESTDNHRFVTGIVGCLEPATGRLRYVNAGHPAAYVVCRGAVRELPSTGVPFGVVPSFGYATVTDELAPGETLALFSDGIPEAQRGDEQFFDERRVREALTELDGAPTLGEVRSGLLERVDAFLAGTPRNDDVTLLLIRREG